VRFQPLQDTIVSRVDDAFQVHHWALAERAHGYVSQSPARHASLAQVVMRELRANVVPLGATIPWLLRTLGTACSRNERFNSSCCRRGAAEACVAISVPETPFDVHARLGVRASSLSTRRPISSRNRHPTPRKRAALARVTRGSDAFGTRYRAPFECTTTFRRDEVAKLTL